MPYVKKETLVELIIARVFQSVMLLVSDLKQGGSPWKPRNPHASLRRMPKLNNQGPVWPGCFSLSTRFQLSTFLNSFSKAKYADRFFKCREKVPEQKSYNREKSVQKHPISKPQRPEAAFYSILRPRVS